MEAQELELAMNTNAESLNNSEQENNLESSSDSLLFSISLDELQLETLFCRTQNTLRFVVLPPWSCVQLAIMLLSLQMIKMNILV